MHDEQDASYSFRTRTYLFAIETIAHLRENGRITVMFQEFEGAPRICRLFGTGVHS